MKVKRFFAQSMAEALKQVSEQMGPDAVILSNRKVDGGVEIVTALDYDENMARQRLGDRAGEATNGSRLAEMQAEQHRRHAAGQRLPHVVGGEIKRVQTHFHYIASRLPLGRIHACPHA